MQPAAQAELLPTEGPTRRAQTHRDAITDEAPIFIDRSAEDPRPYISFREHVPIAVAGNLRGEQTIEALALRRPDLNAARERHFEVAKTLHLVAINTKLSESERTPALALLQKLIAPEAEYALMCQVALAALPPPA
jgi:hypothetical protein